MRNITQKCGWETSPRPFLKNQNWKYLWIDSLKFYTVAFTVCPSRGLSKYIGTSLLSLFSAYFWKKIFLMLYSISWQNFIASLPSLLEILVKMCFVIVYFPVYGVILKLTLGFLSSCFPAGPKKVRTKI